MIQFGYVLKDNTWCKVVILGVQHMVRARSDYHTGHSDYHTRYLVMDYSAKVSLDRVEYARGDAWVVTDEGIFIGDKEQEEVK